MKNKICTKVVFYNNIGLSVSKKLLLICFISILLCANYISAGTVITEKLVSEKSELNAFPLVTNNTSASIYYDQNDYKGVIRVAADLQKDIKRVTGKVVELSNNISENKFVVLVGTLGKNNIINNLVSTGKLDISKLKGKKESFVITTVNNPIDGVDQALIIVGSDKRGTIYGVYELSEHMGVSPWHFWADVPAQTKKEVYVKFGYFFSGEPKVKYRGIFLNDEAPALTGWVYETFGNFNHKFYETVFELLLRNKANYLWPAMWPPRAFNADDSLNYILADEFGIVMSTSHHEPMMRAHAEWKQFGGKAWNYETNKEQLQEFWRGGIERMGDCESVVTMGMRGDGDEAMSEGTAVELLKNIIKDQRTIIEEVTGKPAKETPQVWAIYKEVQDYYDKGMRVDDDILILFCDDNWGNIRILPKKEDLDHTGGYGIYYHFDFVGGPVSYRWLNVTQIERVWEQMNLAYAYGVEDLWLVNVGDLKPMELPISFFLDFAWNPDAIRAGDLPNYYVKWAAQQFGEKYAKEIAEMLALYTKYNARRTPEMLKPNTYSLDNYREAETIVKDYNNLCKSAKDLYEKLPEETKSAFYQLVLAPIEFCNNINEMYVAVGKNRKYADEGRASVNYYADKAKNHFVKDSLLTEYYHNKLADGKWNHMMAQTRIGYTSWNNPEKNIMPDVVYIEKEKTASLGYVAEGIGSFGQSLPQFDPINNQSYYIEIYNRGIQELNYSIKSKDKWIKFSKNEGTVKYEEKVFVSIDWANAPKNNATGVVEIKSVDEIYKVDVKIKYYDVDVKGHVENNRVISIEASNFTKSVNSEDIRWTVIPNMGRTNSSVMAEPVNVENQILDENTPHLEYTFTLFDEGDIDLDVYLSPTLNYLKGEGLKFAVSIDDEKPQIINMHEGENEPDWGYPDWWNKSVTDHIKIKSSIHKSISKGKHKLKVWILDPGIVFQKFVINTGGLVPSYLGPPESVIIK